MDRRNFIKRVGIGVGVAILAPSIVAAPKLWGDGVHDDTTALQHWVNTDSADVELSDMTFLLSDTIRVPELKCWHRLRDCVFLCARPGVTMFNFPRVEEFDMLLYRPTSMMAPNCIGMSVKKTW